METVLFDKSNYTEYPRKTIAPKKNAPERGAYNMKTQKKRVAKELELYKQAGFRCINIVGVRPDFIAIKDGKISAIEVEYGNPRPEKYSNSDKNQYDDVVWILRGRNERPRITNFSTRARNKAKKA